MAQNLSLVPRAPAPWIYMSGGAAGQPTREFYQFIVNLLGLAGGTSDVTLVDLQNYVLTSPAPNTSEQDRAIDDLYAIAMPQSDRAAEIDGLKRRIADLEAIVVTMRV